MVRLFIVSFYVVVCVQNKRKLEIARQLFALFFSHNLRARTICGDLSPQFNGIMSIGTILIAPQIGSVTFALQKIFPVGYISDPILLIFSSAALVL